MDQSHGHYDFDMESMTKQAIEMLHRRDVRVGDIAAIVMELQKPYLPDLTVEECKDAIKAVMNKREVVHAVMTGIAIDEATERGQMPEPISTIIMQDEGLYGIDEILPLSIVNIYGTIGMTNFGYLDKAKLGIIKELDECPPDRCNTFLDDIVAALAAAAASRIAHSVTGPEQKKVARSLQ